MAGATTKDDIFDIALLIFCPTSSVNVEKSFSVFEDVNGPQKMVAATKSGFWMVVSGNYKRLLFSA